MNESAQDVELNLNGVRVKQFPRLAFIFLFVKVIVESCQQFDCHNSHGHVCHPAFLYECIKLIDKSAILAPVSPAAIVINPLSVTFD